LPSSAKAEAFVALRAHLDFLRDLGVYDLYRRGDGTVAAVSATESEQNTATPAKILDAAEGVTTAVADRSLAAVPRTATVSASAIASATATVSATAAAPRTVPELELTPAEPLHEPEEFEIAARKHAPPTMPPLTLPGVILPAAARPAALAAIRAEIGDCMRCQLAHEGRHTIVFGDGDPNARLLFVGEGPGADEDREGIPFIGKAGQLLNNMIVAMQLKREQVYIANIVKCRPPGNRVPEPEEANTCTPFLLQQIGVVRPEVIVALGSTAATYLLGGKKPLSALRGRVHPIYAVPGGDPGIKLIVTYHPAYLLRDPRQKKEAWADLQMAMRELGPGATAATP
jgi:uracil-DNA glycosylase family 4